MKTCSPGDCYHLIPDIPYLGKDRTEQMDAYLPDVTHFPAPHPAVLVIHGGGWAIGDKATPREKDICSTLAKSGYASFSINYLLTRYAGEPWVTPITETAWPRNFQDCREAIRHLRENAEAYHIDSAHVAVLGASAGGHLALLVAFAPHLRPLPDWEEKTPPIQCVISMYGIHDLKQFGADYFPPDETGASVIEEASPATHFKNSGPPVLLIQGDKDTVVESSVANDMARCLQGAGAPHELVWVPGAGHSFDLHPPEMNLEPVVLDFLARFLK